MDWVGVVYVNPPYLRLPGAWKREFGIATTEARDYYTYRSLRSITPQELRQFYDRHDSPARMTLTVIGDLDRDTVLDLVNGTLETLRQAQEPPAAATAKMRVEAAPHFSGTLARTSPTHDGFASPA
jgi:predicted Zn-dependent peptidase